MAQPITGGDAAVLEEWSELLLVGDGCTGVAVGAHHFLTAWHCMPIDSVVTADGVVPVESCVPAPASMVLAVQDVALCHVDAGFTDYARRANSDGMEGDAVVLIGFGMTDYDSADFGELRVVDSRIESVNVGEFTAGTPEGGSCVGDSGGPAFRKGERELIGILTSGPAGICGLGYYADVAALSPWLDDELRPHPGTSCQAAPGPGVPPWAVFAGVLGWVLHRRRMTRSS